MLRIERQSKGTSTDLKLSGRMQADELSGLLGEIEKCNPGTLDLEEVTLLDRDSVRARSTFFIQPSGVSNRGRLRPMLWILNSGGATSARAVRWGEEPASSLAQLAMTALYTVTAERANAKWVGNWVGCFFLYSP